MSRLVTIVLRAVGHDLRADEEREKTIERLCKRADAVVSDSDKTMHDIMLGLINTGMPRQVAQEEAPKTRRVNGVPGV